MSLMILRSFLLSVFFSHIVINCSAHPSLPSPSLLLNAVKLDENDSQIFLSPDGKKLDVIGVNRFAIYEAQDNLNDLSPEAYFQLLAQNKFNVLRVFVREGFIAEGSRPNVAPLESRIGEYSVAHLAELDQVFKLAEKYHIYIILALFDHYFIHHSWTDNFEQLRNLGIFANSPYFEKGTPSDYFYTSPKTKPAQLQRILTLVNRYKNEPQLLAWEPMNEVNGVLEVPYASQKDSVVNWFNQMGAAIKNADPRHLITVSTTGDLYWEDQQFKPWKGLYSSPYADIIQLHCYGVDNGDLYINTAFATYVKEAKKYKKAVIVGEFAPSKKAPNRKQLIKNFLLASKKLDVPAFIWTHRFDNYGDLDSAALEAYQEAYFPKQ